jgi:cob(I)alamin adenosyltransferase
MPFTKKKTTKEEIAQKGLVLVNIGAGKGKTTAAFGSAIRASGAGLNVFVLQFVKASKPKEGRELQPGEWPLSSEVQFLNDIKIPRGMGRIDCEQVGAGFVGILGDRKEKEQHMREALRGLEMARKVLAGKEYDLIILDEILSAVDLELLTEQDIIDLIQAKPYDTHVIMTGHEKYPKIFKLCDTVTEMKMVKHAYYNGVLAQFGIDY